MTRDLHPEAQEVQQELGSNGIPGKRVLPVDEARRLLDEILANRGADVSLEAVRNLRIPGPEDPLPIRVYRPEGEAPHPVLVYFHGGAWIRGSIESHDPVCRRIADRSGFLVISVDYRLAPENKFPAQVEDAYAAVEWVTENAGSIWGDPEQVAIGGDSAGGNLAASVSLLARDRGGPSIQHQLLLYPTVNYEAEMPSYEQNEGYFNTQEDRLWIYDQYLASDIDGRNKYAYPLQADDFTELPSATVLTCEFDMLRDEGQAYAEQLRDAGVSVDELFYDDVFHAFLNFPDIEPADQAFDDIGAALRKAFGKTG